MDELAVQCDAGEKLAKLRAAYEHGALTDDEV